MGRLALDDSFLVLFEHVFQAFPNFKVFLKLGDKFFSNRGHLPLKLLRIEMGRSEFGPEKLPEFVDHRMD